MHMRCWATIAALSAVAVPLQAAGSREQAIRAVIAQCVRAWDKSDAAGIAAEFEPDADFVSPDGIRAIGARSNTPEVMLSPKNTHTSSPPCETSWTSISSM